MSVLVHEVVSDRDQTISGLGVFKAGVPQSFGPDEVAGFQQITGIPLNQDNVPAGVTVTISIVELASEKGEEG